jgi:hypothetical protein
MGPRDALTLMDAHVDSGTRTAREQRYVPAYGPVDAVLGYSSVRNRSHTPDGDVPPCP